MCQSFLNRDAVVRVVGQHLPNQIDSHRIGALKKLVKVLALAFGQAEHKLFVLPVFDLVNELDVGVTKEVVDLLHLLVFVLGRQKGFAGDEFSQDAPHRPDVDFACILLLRQNDFRSSIPTSRDVVCHLSRLSKQVRDVRSGQAEVAYFQVTITVDQQVARLEISVKNARRVEVLKATQDLVEEELDVLFRQGLVGFNYLGEVSFHEFSHNVEFVQFLQGVRLQH